MKFGASAWSSMRYPGLPPVEAMSRGVLDGLPLWFVFGAIAAVVLGFSHIYLQILHFLVPALVLPILFRTDLVSRLGLETVAMLGLGMAWLLIGSAQLYGGVVLLPDLASARIAQDAACVVVLIASALHPGSHEQRLQRIAAASVLSLLIVCVCVIVGYSAGFPHGNPNFTVTALAPGCLLALGWVCHRFRMLPRLIALVAIGSIYFYYVFFVTPGDPRRGMALAGVAAVGGLVWDMIRERHPRLAWTLFAVAVVLASAVVVHAFARQVTDIRSDRIFLYSAGASAAWEWLPWGRGPYAMLGLEFATAEAARERIACGHWALHAHNEMLDVLLRGGIPLLLVYILGCGLLIVGLLRIRERKIRAPLLAWVAGMAVLLTTDNGFSYFGQEMWAAMIGGVILSIWSHQDERAISAHQWPRIVPLGVRGAACGMALIAGLAFIREMPALAMTAASPRSDRITLALRSRLPEIIRLEGEDALAKLLGDHDYGAFLPLDQGIRGKTRHATATPFYSDLIHRRQVDLCWEACLKLLRGRWTTDTARQIRELCQVWSIADSNILRLELQILRRLPFNAVYHQELYRLISRRPDFLRFVPARLILRGRQYMGDPGCPPPVFHDHWRGVEDAADDLAGVAWLTITGAPWKEISPKLEQIASRYPHVNDVALWAIRSRVDAKAEDMPWFETLLPRLAIGMVWTSSNRRVLITHFIETPRQARESWPILCACFPEITAKIERGMCAVPPGADEWLMRVCFDLIEINAMRRLEDGVLYRGQSPLRSASNPGLLDFE